MSKVSDPFVYFVCKKCRREIERKISAKRARQEIEELRDGPDLFCAECFGEVTV